MPQQQFGLGLNGLSKMELAESGLDSTLPQRYEQHLLNLIESQSMFFFPYKILITIFFLWQIMMTVPTLVLFVQMIGKIV